jgi:peptide deformylase
MIRPILIYPRLPLKTACIYPQGDEVTLKYIADNKALFLGLIKDLTDTLAEIPQGVGLASNQIGHPDEAIAVMDPAKSESFQGKRSAFHALYPTLLEGSYIIKVREGCLSFPQYFESVERFGKVTVKYFTLEGSAPIIEEATDFMAQIWQHEIDHLSGQLFIDKLSPMKRDMAVKKMTKTRRRIDDFQWIPKKHAFFGSKSE